jgi:hypothetical protein
MAETLENPEDKVRNNCISVERSKQFMRTVTAPARSPRRDHMDHYHHSCSEDLRMKGKKMMRAAPRAEARLNKENKGVVVRGSRFEVRRSKMSCFAWDKKCEFAQAAACLIPD